MSYKTDKLYSLLSIFQGIQTNNFTNKSQGRKVVVTTQTCSFRFERIGESFYKLTSAEKKDDYEEFED